MIMEKTIQLVAGLPHKSKLRETLTNTFLNELWYTLDHPPMIYLGDKYRYRQADGSYNNPLHPSLGAANSNYARTCRAGVVQPGALPDPELIFESIMKRTNYRKHQNNVSSILWYWATIIIHDLFWTDHENPEVTKTSSYLDLSPLYGSNQAMQDSIRTFKDGLMKPDTYADKRLHGMPPGCSVILYMFNRFHNYTARNLAAINEHGRFTPPSPDLSEEKAAAAWKKYDNDLFQTARLITNGLYINITLVDYVRNIVNLNRSNTTWTLDPRQEMGKNAGTNTGAERGTGSMVSAEFNLCYRWHSCISAKDEKWTGDFFQELFGKPAEDVTKNEVMMGFYKFGKSVPDEPSQRVFGGYQRQADGTFNDDDMVNCISDAIEDCAGQFGGRHVPAAMKPVEIMGIIQGRKWEVAGLNEFRKHFGLKPFETMEEINSDPEIAESLRHLYSHPDFVELYPGMVAEEAKSPMVPGVGIAPTYTISRVILSDAVCLTRGDRFYTTDYNPRSLTNWGYNEVSYDLELNQGCTFYKLFLRAFPNHFKHNSAYAHYPMCVPSETQKIMTNLGRVQDFDFSRPVRSSSAAIVLASPDAAQQVLANPTGFAATRDDAAEFLATIGGKPFSSTSSDSKLLSAAQAEAATLSKDGAWAAATLKFYASAADKLIRDNSYLLAGQRFVDIVRDVGNAAPTQYAAALFGLPLRSGPNDKKGVYDTDELFTVLALTHACLFRGDLDPVKAFPFRMAAKSLVHQLGGLIEAKVKSGKADKAQQPVSGYGSSLIQALKKGGKSATNYDIAYTQVLPAAASLVPTTAELFAESLDYYIAPKPGAAHGAALYDLACAPVSEESDALLLGYALEGLRLGGSGDGASSASFRQVGVDDVLPSDDGGKIHVKSGDKVFVSSVRNFLAITSPFLPTTLHSPSPNNKLTSLLTLPSKKTTQDAARFPTPEEVNPRRPVASYAAAASGLAASATLNDAVVRASLTALFRSAFKLKNLRRAPGPQGLLRRVSAQGGQAMGDVYLRDDAGCKFYIPLYAGYPFWFLKSRIADHTVLLASAYQSFPSTMRVVYDP